MLFMQPLTSRAHMAAVSLVAIALVVALAPIARSASASTQTDISFETTPAQFVVEVDGSVIAFSGNESDAASAASEAKLADPDATVLYRSVQTSIAGFDLDPANVDPANVDPANVEPQDPAPASGTPNLVWGYDATPPSPAWSQPALLGDYIDAAYGTTITRMTSADGTRFNRNTYSRRQAENADGSWFLTYHGDAAYHVYDRSTGALIRALDISPDAWPQWHPSNPNLIRYTGDDNSYGGNLVVHQVDVASGQSQALVDLTNRIQTELPDALYMHDRAEGSPSRDGNRWAWLIYDEQEDAIGLASYDLVSDQLHVLDAENFDDSSPVDWVSASPTGDYVLAGHWDGTWVYNHDLTNARLVFAGGEHSDIALNAAGRDAYVYIDFTASSEGGWLVSVDLDSLTHTLIFDLYDDANTSIHISGKGYNKPGWVVASTYNCKEPGAWSCEKVMAVELAPNGRVLNLAHTYNCGADYWTETHAVVNRDFTRVYFNSDSGSCGIDAEVFMIEVPAFS